MAGGRRNLRSVTSGAEDPVPRDDLGQGPDVPRTIEVAMPDVEVTSHTRPTRASAATPDAATPPPTREARETTPSGDLQTSVRQLLDALNAAELAGAPAPEIEIRQRQFDRAIEALHRIQPGQTPAQARPAFDEAGRIMRVLNNVQPKPRLGSENRAPTTQQVDQWVKDIDTAFQYAQLLTDTITRTHWIMGTIQFNTY